MVWGKGSEIYRLISYSMSGRTMIVRETWPMKIKIEGAPMDALLPFRTLDRFMLRNQLMYLA